jgi:hypothetical protein
MSSDRAMAEVFEPTQPTKIIDSIGAPRRVGALTIASVRDLLTAPIWDGRR